jgi:ribosome-binding factor A
MSLHGRKDASQRPLRVGEALRHALSEILMRGDVRDPELREASITVSEVRVSPDLRNATVYIMPLGGTDAAGVLAALRRAAPYLRSRVAQAVRLRFAPALKFEVDTSFEHAAHIEALLHSDAVARDLAEGVGDGDRGDRGDDGADRDGRNYGQDGDR